MSDPVIIAMIVAIPPTFTALCGLGVSLINQRKLRTLHLQVNSRLDQLLISSKNLSHAEGMQAQRDLDKEHQK